MSEVEAMGVPRHLVNIVRRLRVVAPSGKVYEFEARGDLGAVIDVRGFYQELAERAVSHGAEVLVARRAQRLEVLSNRLTVDARSASFEARLVVDASGAEAWVRRELGLFRKWERYGVGAEYEVYAPGLEEEDVAVIALGGEVAPSGYAWVFPCGDRRARVGVGILRPFSRENPMRYLEHLLKKSFVKELLGDRVGVVELHTGVFPSQGLVKPLTYGRVVFIGDAGGFGSPLMGEGIRFAYRSGAWAAEAAARFLEGDEGALKRFEDESFRRLGRDFAIALRVQEAAARGSDRVLEKGVEAVAELVERAPELAVAIMKTEILGALKGLGPLRALRLLKKLAELAKDVARLPG